MTDYAFHPIADLFPLIEGEQFDALCADVKKNGLRHNIMLFEGKILDGRNRYRACKAVGEEPRYTEISNINVVSYFSLRKAKDPAIYTNKELVDSIVSKGIEHGISPRDFDVFLAGVSKSQHNNNKQYSRMVYVAKSGNLIKVGCSSEPELRIQQLQFAHPKIHLLYVWRGDFADEKYIHSKIYDVALGGEWFSYSKETILLIKKIMEGHRVFIDDGKVVDNLFTLLDLRTKALARGRLNALLNNWNAATFQERYAFIRALVIPFQRQHFDEQTASSVSKEITRIESGEF